MRYVQLEINICKLLNFISIILNNAVLKMKKFIMVKMLLAG